MGWLWRVEVFSVNDMARHRSLCAGCLDHLCSEHYKVFMNYRSWRVDHVVIPMHSGVCLLLACCGATMCKLPHSCDTVGLPQLVSPRTTRGGMRILPLFELAGIMILFSFALYSHLPTCSLETFLFGLRHVPQ